MFHNPLSTEYNINLRIKLILTILGITGAGMIFYLINLHGVWISSDSVYYISVARHITEGVGFTGYDGYHFVLQPPLYPLLLTAVKSIMSTDPLVSAGYINSILFGLIIYFSGLLLLRHLHTYILVILGTISFLISFAFIQTFLIAMSEPLFILLILAYLFSFENYRVKGNITSIILLSAAAALACLTRYIGVIMIFTGVCSILLIGNKLFKEKIKHTAIFLFITCIPIGVWIIRNYILSNTLFGQRAASSFSLQENIDFLFSTIFQWYVAMQISFEQIIYFSIISGILFIAVLFIRRNTIRKNIEVILPALIFVSFYSLIIVITSTTTAYDKISNRLLSPIFLPLFFISFFICDKIIIWLKKYVDTRLVSLLVAMCLILWMIYPAGKLVNIIEHNENFSNPGFTGINWENNKTIKYLLENKELGNRYTLYSNVPEAIYILTNMESKWSPAKTFYNSTQLINTDLSRLWQGDNKICLVWFDEIDRNFLFSVKELEKSTRMKKIAQFNDGAVYTFRN